MPSTATPILGLRRLGGLKNFLFHSQHPVHASRSSSQSTIPFHTPFSIIQYSAPPAPSSTPRALLNNIRTLASKARRLLHDQSCSPYHAARNTNPGRRRTSVAKKRGRIHRADRTRSSAARCPSERHDISDIFTCKEDEVLKRWGGQRTHAVRSSPHPPLAQAVQQLFD